MGNKSKLEQERINKAIKYIQESYCTYEFKLPFMLLGDVAELIKILTDVDVDVDVAILEKYKK